MGADERLRVTKSLGEVDRKGINVGVPLLPMGLPCHHPWFTLP